MNEVRLSRCTGKDPLSRSVAKRVADRMRTAWGCNIAHYKCNICGKWHVGSTTLKKRERTRR